MNQHLPAHDRLIIAQATEDLLRRAACPGCGAVNGTHLFSCAMLPELDRPPPLPDDVDDWTEEERAEHPAGPVYQWEEDVRP